MRKGGRYPDVCCYAYGSRAGIKAAEGRLKSCNHDQGMESMSQEFDFSHFITPDFPEIPSSILKMGERKILYEGSELSNIGDRPTHIYYIYEGELSLNIISSDGKERSCMFVRKNMFYGEAHLYRNFSALFRVVATMPTVLISFSLQQARTLIERSAEFRIALLNGQAQKIFSMTGELVSLIVHSPEERVMHCLLDMAKFIPVQHGVREIRISQQAIARRLGVHRVTVTKALASLKSSGHILYSRGKVILPDKTV